VRLFDAALGVVLKHEGGYVNDPQDPGGETIFGISRRSHPEAWANGRPSQAQAALIYRQDYWDRCKCDELPAPIAVMVLDTAVNCGGKRAIQMLQRAIDVDDDGVLGPKTIQRCKELDVETSVNTMAEQRKDYYRGLSTFSRFGKGWIRRVDDVLTESLSLVGAE
jgi:lysozyme family protein